MRKPQKIKPLTVEQTIVDCIRRYPMLFQTRTEVLHHLFIVNGCGYRWANGRLNETYRERGQSRIPLAEARKLAKQTCIIDNPYPLCQYANLMTMPEDVLPDWKAAAEEIRAAIPNLKLHTYDS